MNSGKFPGPNFNAYRGVFPEVPVAFTGTFAICGTGIPYSSGVATNVLGPLYNFRSFGLPAGLVPTLVYDSSGYASVYIVGITASAGVFSGSIYAEDINGRTITLPSTITVGWSPSLAFAAGELGIWLDPSDFSTMFQDTGGTNPVTASGQSVKYMRDKSGRGNHVHQNTTANAPVLRLDGAGNYYLQFTAVNLQWLELTSSNNLYIQNATSHKAMIFASGVKFDTISDTQIVFSRSLSGPADGRYYLDRNSSNNLLTGWANSVGGADASAAMSAIVNKVLSGSIDVSSGSGVMAMHINAAASATNTYASAGANVNLRFLIGAYEGASVGVDGATPAAGDYMNGRIYGLVLRLADTLDTTMLANMETYMDSKCAAY